MTEAATMKNPTLAERCCSNNINEINTNPKKITYTHFPEVAPFEASLWRQAASALFRGDRRCLSLMIVDAPGVSLINRQSQLINN